jgi:hypothetical protein
MIREGMGSSLPLLTPRTVRQMGAGAIRMEGEGDNNGNNEDNSKDDNNNAQQLHKHNKLHYMPV